MSIILISLPRNDFYTICSLCGKKIKNSQFNNHFNRCSSIEYIYILTKKHNHIYEYVSTDGSIYSIAKFALDKEEITDDEIYGFANVYAVLNGRRVK